MWIQIVKRQKQNKINKQTKKKENKQTKYNKKIVERGIAHFTSKWKCCLAWTKLQYFNTGKVHLLSQQMWDSPLNL